jgi:hypothetical protein
MLFFNGLEISEEESGAETGQENDKFRRYYTKIIKT